MSASKRKSNKQDKKGKVHGNTSDYRLFIVIAGAVILAFVMICLIIFTTPG